jgi:TRAP-type C4-dicarboxylate transport system permease small subunit
VSLRRGLDLVFAAAGALGALAVFAIFALMIFASIGRMAGWRVGGINDIVSWLTAAAAFFAMAHAFKQGDFVRVTLLLEQASRRVRHALEVASLSVATLAVGYLAWWAARFTWESYTFNDIAGGLVVIPIWIPQTTFVIGALLLLMAVLDELVIVLAGGTPSYVRRVEERHARGDYSEDV